MKAVHPHLSAAGLPLGPFGEPRRVWHPRTGDTSVVHLTGTCPGAAREAHVRLVDVHADNVCERCRNHRTNDEIRHLNDTARLLEMLRIARRVIDAPEQSSHLRWNLLVATHRVGVNSVPRHTATALDLAQWEEEHLLPVLREALAVLDAVEGAPTGDWTLRWACAKLAHRSLLERSVITEDAYPHLVRSNTAASTGYGGSVKATLFGFIDASLRLAATSDLVAAATDAGINALVKALADGEVAGGRHPIREADPDQWFEAASTQVALLAQRMGELYDFEYADAQDDVRVYTFAASASNIVELPEAVAWTHAIGWVDTWTIAAIAPAAVMTACVMRTNLGDQPSDVRIVGPVKPGEDIPLSLVQAALEMHEQLNMPKATALEVARAAAL